MAANTPAVRLMNRGVLKPNPLFKRYGIPALIAFVVLVTFLPVVGNDFVALDDPYYFIENPYYRGLSLANLRWMFTTLDFSHYQPLSWLTHALVYSVWGLSPTAYHVGNVLIHAINAVLLYFLVRAFLQWGGGGWPTSPLALSVSAAAGALFFAIHPLRVEAVACASERQEVLSACFLTL